MRTTRIPVPVENRKAVLCLVLVLMTLAVYNSVTQNAFLFFDDNTYIVNNPHVHDGLTLQTLKWSFTTFHAGNWHPLTWLSHALDYMLFHLNPAGHHYVTVLLHTACVVVLFLVLRNSTGRVWPSFIVAGLFAVHPVNVESVAWAAERKNVLSMLFCLLTLFAYCWYVRKPNVRRYLLVALLFSLGLMAKPQVITLPFVLLLWDYWPLQRLRRPVTEGAGLESEPSSTFFRLVLEKTPLLGLAVLSAVITMVAQRAGNAVRTLTEYSFGMRMENAVISYVRYLGIAFWPWRLAPMYPRLGNSNLLLQAVGSGLLLLLLSLLVWRYRQYRFMVVGWLWFLITLLPMIGVIQVGEQAMADRYAYLAFVGLFLMVIWGLAEVVRAWKISPAWAAAAAAAVLLALGTLSYRQLGFWRDSVTLWSYTLRVTHNNYMAHANLAIALDKQGRAEEAIVHYHAAIALHEYPPSELLKFAIYEETHGHVQDAMNDFIKVLRTATEPAMQAAALADIAALYLQLGRSAEAQATYERALRLDPNNSSALMGAGLAAERNGDFGLAAGHFSRAVQVAPTDIGFLLLAATLRKAGRPIEAQTAQDQAGRISSDFSQAEIVAKRLLAQ